MYLCRVVSCLKGKKCYYDELISNRSILIAVKIWLSYISNCSHCNLLYLTSFEFAQQWYALIFLHIIVLLALCSPVKMLVPLFPFFAVLDSQVSRSGTTHSIIPGHRKVRTPCGVLTSDLIHWMCRCNDWNERFQSQYLVWESVCLCVY